MSVSSAVRQSGLESSIRHKRGSWVPIILNLSNIIAMQHSRNPGESCSLKTHTRCNFNIHSFIQKRVHILTTFDTSFKSFGGKQRVIKRTLSWQLWCIKTQTSDKNNVQMLLFQSVVYANCMIWNNFFIYNVDGSRYNIGRSLTDNYYKVCHLHDLELLVDTLDLNGLVKYCNYLKPNTDFARHIPFRLNPLNVNEWLIYVVKARTWLSSWRNRN